MRLKYYPNNIYMCINLINSQCKCNVYHMYTVTHMYILYYFKNLKPPRGNILFLNFYLYVSMYIFIFSCVYICTKSNLKFMHCRLILHLILFCHCPFIHAMSRQ